MFLKLSLLIVTAGFVEHFSNMIFFLSSLLHKVLIDLFKDDLLQEYQWKIDRNLMRKKMTCQKKLHEILSFI